MSVPGQSPVGIVLDPSLATVHAPSASQSMRRKVIFGSRILWSSALVMTSSSSLSSPGATGAAAIPSATPSGERTRRVTSRGTTEPRVRGCASQHRLARRAPFVLYVRAARCRRRARHTVDIHGRSEARRFAPRSEVAPPSFSRRERWPATTPTPLPMDTTTTAPASEFPLATDPVPTPAAAAARGSAAARNAPHMPTPHAADAHAGARGGFQSRLERGVALGGLAPRILSSAQVALVFDISNTNSKINTNIQTVLNFFVYPTVVVLSHFVGRMGCAWHARAHERERADFRCRPPSRRPPVHRARLATLPVGRPFAHATRTSLAGPREAPPRLRLPTPTTRSTTTLVARGRRDVGRAAGLVVARRATPPAFLPTGRWTHTRCST